MDNEGTIHAETGDVYLIGSQVTNGGTISAPQGTAGLAAGNQIVFEQAGDQNLYVQATPLTATRAVGVTNSGTIHAAAAVLKAAGGNAYALAINNTGQIAATGFKKIHGQVLLTSDGGNIDNSGTIIAHESNGNGGKIVLNGYGKTSRGTVLSSGKLIATGRKAGTKGGTVEVLGNQVGITGFGLVDVSGSAGGGTALIGGDEHGANADVPDADQTYLGPNATIKADAFTLGDGGKVILWGNETTQAYGKISARGGAQGGNGGLVETSGKTLDAQTAPDVAAPKGKGGTWLLDPSDIYISDSTTTTSGFSAPFTITSGNTYNLSQDDLSAVLQVGNVTLDASEGSGTGSGTINWTDTLGEVFKPALSGATTLTLNGPGGVSINNVTMAPSGAALNVVLNSSITGAGPVQVNNSSIATNGGSFTANGNGYISSVDSTGVLISNSTINAGGGNINLTGNAGFGNQSDVGIVVGNGVYIGGGESSTDLIETSGTGNITITATAAQDVTTLDGITALNLYGGGSDGGSSATIQVGSGLLSITGNVTAGTAEVGSDSGGVTGVDIAGGAIVKATAAGGSVTLAGDVSGATVVIEPPDTNGVNATGVEIDNYDGGGTTVSVVGSTNGTGGILTITGTGATLDTTYSTIAANNVPYTQGVDINNGATVSAGANATIKITGTGGSVVTSVDSDVANSGDYTGGSEGISIDGASLTMGTGGTLTMTGTGGSVNAGYGANAGDADSHGVDMGGDNGATTISLGTGGSMTFTGYGGTVDNSNAEPVTGKDMPSTQGFSVDSGTQLTAAGTTTITITGTGGTITPGTNTDGDAIGVNIGSGDGNNGDNDESVNTLVSSQSGNITITGYGGSSPNLSIGVEAHGFNSHSTTIETTTGGSISMTGTAGAGYVGDGTPFGNSIPSYGAGLFDGVTVSTTGSGSLVITGTGTGQAAGVAIREVDDTLLDPEPTLPQVSVGGALTITATSGSAGIVNGAGEYLNGTFTAGSAVIGTETSPGDSTTIASGSLQIVDSTFTLSSSPIVEEFALISKGPIQIVIPPSSNFTAYGAGYVSATDANGNPDGIDIVGSTIDAQGGGSIALTGTGGHVYGGSSYTDGIGVNLYTDTNVTTLETSGLGSITVTATAGSPGIISDEGAYAFSDYGANQITVVNGIVTINGTVTGHANGLDENGGTLVGVEVGGGANIAATGTGNVTLTGDISRAQSTVFGPSFSFADGIEIGSEATVSVQGGTLTLNGTGTSIDASGYDGEDRVFSTGVQMDNDSALSAGTDGQIMVTGTIKSSAVGNGADLVGTLITLNSSVTGGTGSQVSLTGTTTGSNVISSAGGSSNVGLEIDNPAVAVVTDAAVFKQAAIATPSTTTVSVGASGALTLKGTSGSIDGSFNLSQDNQAGTAGIDIDGTTQITAGLGTSVTMTGTGGAATVTSDPTSGFTAVSGGVFIDGVPLTFDGGNVVTITGTGGSADNGYNVAGNDSNPASSIGVEFDYSSNSLVSLGTGGSLTVYGYGGAVSTVNASASTTGDTFADSTGVGIHSNIEATGNTTISINGYGGDITSGSSIDGVSFGTEVGGDSQPVTLSTETGTLTVYGQAGLSPNLGLGVALHGFNANQTLVESTSGDITITGLGGAGNSGPGNFTGFFEPNYGVAALDDVAIKTTAGGTVSITGTAGAGENNADGVGFTTTSDTSVDPTPVDPDINANGAVTINALSGGGIVLATTTVEAPSLQIGSVIMSDGSTNITSGPVRILGTTFTLTGPLTVYGAGGGTGDPLQDAIEINGSTLNAGTGNIVMLATGGRVNAVGIDVEESTIETASAGTITLTGDIGGTQASSPNDMVAVDLFDATISTATGALSVSGTVSGSQAGGMTGLRIQSGTIGSTTGPVTLDGTVSASTSADSGAVQGITINDGALIQSTSGTLSATGLVTAGSDSVAVDGLLVNGATLKVSQNGGSVTLVGNTTGATTVDASNVGLSLDGSVTTQNGAGISITGTSGGASVDDDFEGTTLVAYGTTLTANLSTTGTAPITIKGTGGAIEDETEGGLSLQSTGADFYNNSGTETISTVDGLIKITGTGGTSDNGGFGVNMFATATTPYKVTSTTGEIEIDGTAGASPVSQSIAASATYEPNIGVALGDDISLSTGGPIAITGQGIALGSTENYNGSGIAIEIGSFGGYADGTGSADNLPTTPQLSAGTTISLTSKLGTVNVDDEEGAQSESSISGTFVVTTPLQKDFSVLNNLAGSVSLGGGGDFALNGDATLAVQTGMGGAESIFVSNSAGIQLGPISAASLELEAFGGSITQSGAITVTQLLVDSSAAITLLNTGNNISQLDNISSTGAISIYTDPGLALLDGVTSGGPVLLESIGGGIVLDEGASVTDTGSGNITLVTDQAFVNDSGDGSSALVASNGVYHIYAGDSTNTNLGGLPVAFTQYNTTYPTDSSMAGNGLFYSGNGTSGGGTGGGSSNPPPPDTGGGTLLPPVVAAPPPPPPPYTNPYTPPPTDFTGGTGGISQTGSQSGGLAFASGNGGNVGAGDTAQLNDGQMNNVSNPHAAGELDSALSGPVRDSLVDALTSVGAFVDTETYGDTSDDEKKKGKGEQVIGDGGVVEIGGGTVQQIPLSSAPKPLQDALGSGVMQGLQPAGH